MAGFNDAMMGGAAPAPMGGMAAPAGGGAAQGMAEQDGFGETGDVASDEEEALLEAFMDRAADVMIPQQGQFNPQVIADLRGEIDPKALQMFEGAEPPVDPKNPADAIAAAGVLLVITIDAKLGYQKKANGEGDEGDGPSHTAVLWEGSQLIIGMLADIAEQAGLAQFGEEELGGIWLRASDLYRYASPTLDREAMKGELVNMEMAAREGEIPGLPTVGAGQQQQAPAQPAPQMGA